MALKKINYKDTVSISPFEVPTFSSNSPEIVGDISLVSIETITLDPEGEFQKIFPINENDLEKITESIKQKGFYKHQPLIISEILQENRSFLIDGHTRFQASINAGLDKVPVYTVTFDTRKEAILFCYNLQLNRRNLTDSQKLKAISAMDFLKSPGKKNETESNMSTGKSSEIIAKSLGVSPRQVEKSRVVLNAPNSEEILKEIEEGKSSINKAYNEIKKAEKTEKSQKKEGSDDSESDIEIEIDEDEIKFIPVQKIKSEYEKGYEDGIKTIINELKQGGKIDEIIERYDV